jgi:hypothetical protein
VSDDDYLRTALAGLGHPAPGPLPDWLEGPVNAVLADLQRPTPIDVTVRHASAHVDGWEAIFVVEARDERWFTSFPIESSARGAELLVRIADGFQEQVFPELRGSWGEARPECPGHPHPAEPEVIDGEAWWVCPRDERQVKPIGSS